MISLTDAAHPMQERFDAKQPPFTQGERNISRLFGQGAQRTPSVCSRWSQPPSPRGRLQRRRHSFRQRQKAPPWGSWRAAPEGVTPPRENGIAERPQTLRYSEIINILSAIYAQSNAERILNCPAPGGVHHKIRAFGNAVLRKVPLLQWHPPGGKIRVACALPRL